MYNNDVHDVMWMWFVFSKKDSCAPHLHNDCVLAFLSYIKKYGWTFSKSTNLTCRAKPVLCVHLKPDILYCCAEDLLLRPWCRMNIFYLYVEMCLCMCFNHLCACVVNLFPPLSVVVVCDGWWVSSADCLIEWLWVCMLFQGSDWFKLPASVSPPLFTSNQPTCFSVKMLHIDFLMWYTSLSLVGVDSIFV